MKNLEFDKIRVLGGFWRHYMDLNRSSVVRNVYERFRETGRFDALKCLWREGMEGKPHYFWDSDVMKWIEGAAYIISEEADASLEALIDEMVEDICENQREDGYFNSYFQTVEPDAVFQRRECHELYCLGHAIEAAIAYHRATGKDKLLLCVLKWTDLVYRVFYEEKSAGFITPGHEEIELALIKLYDHTGDERHLRLARYFIHMRGCNEKDEHPLYNKEYYQSDVPVREIGEAVGHSVRACYLYSAMADLGKRDKDEALLQACERVFDDIVTTKMSITGGIGADHRIEGFSKKYNIPLLASYNETCAAISLSFFAHAMQSIAADSRYGDIIERVLYNGVLSGLSLDGERFFYSNPMEVELLKYNTAEYLPWCERIKVFDCSCCPPNMVRLLASVGRYAYSVEGECIYCNQFADSEALLDIGGKECRLRLKTDYPASGRLSFEYSGAPARLYVRIPDWCVEYSGQRENGYAVFELKGNDKIEIELPMEVHFVEADPRVQSCSGRYALQRGPLVYCMEAIDNGESLRDVTVVEGGKLRVETEEGIPAPVIYASAERRALSGTLYRIKSGERRAFTARLIPYFAFANRGVTDMLIWTMVR